MTVYTRERSNQMFWGLILIGAGVLWLVGDFWPGVLFLVGAALIVRNMLENRHWTESKMGIALIVLGFLFWLPHGFGLLCPAVLIAAGLAILFAHR
jgi:hypothetical protein